MTHDSNALAEIDRRLRVVEGLATEGSVVDPERERTRGLSAESTHCVSEQGGRGGYQQNGSNDRAAARSHHYRAHDNEAQSLYRSRSYIFLLCIPEST